MLVCHFGILIIKFAHTLELIIGPVTLVGELARLIVEFSFALHFIESPFTLVHSSILIIKYTKTMTHTLPFIPFVLTTLPVSLNHIFSLLSFWYPRIRLDLRWRSKNRLLILVYDWSLMYHWRLITACWWLLII